MGTFVNSEIEAAAPLSTARQLCYGGIALGAQVALALCFQRLAPPAASQDVAWTAVRVAAAPVLMLALIAAAPSLRRRRRSPSLIIGAGLVAGMLSAMVVINPGFLRTVLGSPSALLPVTFFVPALGVQLVIHSLRHRRVGDSLHCPQCDYELGVPPEAAPILCPECGTGWLGRWVRGASRRSPGRAAIGAALVLSGLLPVALQFTALGGAAVRLLPTTTLINVISFDAWGRNNGAWTEFSLRTLSQNQRDRLAGKLLDLRLRTGYLYGSPATWLDAEAGAGTIQQTLIDRYYAEWFIPRLEGPERVRRGEAPQVRLFAADHKGGPNRFLFVWVDAVEIDGQFVDVERFHAQGWVFSLDFTPEMAAAKGELRPLALMGEWSPGPHTIRVMLDTCVMPAGQMPPPLAYAADGKPVPVPGAAHYATLTVEKTIIVE